MKEKLSYKNFFKQFIDDCNKKSFKGNSIEEFNYWICDFKILLSSLLGLYVLPNFYCSAKTLEEVKKTDHTCTKLYLETLPNVVMPVYKLTPLKSNGKIAIALPCHGSNKDITCGIDSTPEYAKAIEEYPDRTYALQLVKKGYTVYCPDQVGGGERALDPKDSLNGSCTSIANAALSLGITYSGLYVNDLIKLVDYIYDTNTNVDLTCLGFSGGGLHAMYLAALDDRVHKCVVSGYIHNYANSVLETHLCSCNFIPKIWSLCEMSDIAIMIAPRPLFIENGTEDRLNGTLGISDPITEVDKIKKVYKIFGAENKIVHHTFYGGHKFTGQCFDFLDTVE